MKSMSYEQDTATPLHLNIPISALRLLTSVLTHIADVIGQQQVYRHGNSCQNIATQCQNKAEGCDPNYDFEIIDSTLSDWGVDGSKNQSKVIPQPDLVMTSTLLRAVETGLYQFPKNQIYPVPWIKEVDYKPPNVPEIVSKQNATITQMDGAKNAAVGDDSWRKCWFARFLPSLWHARTNPLLSRVGIIA